MHDMLVENTYLHLFIWRTHVWAECKGVQEGSTSTRSNTTIHYMYLRFWHFSKFCKCVTESDMPGRTKMFSEIVSQLGESHTPRCH